MTDTAELKRKQRIKNLRTALKSDPSSMQVYGGTRKAPVGFLRRYRSVFLALAIFLLGSSVAQRLSVGPGDYVLAEHLDEPGISVTALDGTSEAYTMRELAYYILRIEREGDRQARAYKPEDPTAYWKVRLSTTQQASYVSQMAKKTVLDYAERDLLYSLEAKKAGIALDETEVKGVRDEAERFWLKMSTREREATGLNVESISRAMEKEKLSLKMMRKLADEGIAEADVGSEYFTELLLSYSCERSPSATEELRVGYVTIN